MRDGRTDVADTTGIVETMFLLQTSIAPGLEDLETQWDDGSPSLYHLSVGLDPRKRKARRLLDLDFLAFKTTLLVFTHDDHLAHITSIEKNGIVVEHFVHL